MIGSIVFYIEGGVVKSSDVIATELKELKDEELVILTLRDGFRVDKKRACFNLSELFVQLKRDFEMMKAKGD